MGLTDSAEGLKEKTEVPSREETLSPNGLDLELASVSFSWSLSWLACLGELVSPTIVQVNALK